MLGISYGELFLLIGATAALVGPKDLPRIARVAGRFAGRSIAYVQLARGQFDNVMQQSQARQVHKELQDTMAQLEAIRYEIRSMSMMNPGPMTRNFIDNSIGNSPQSDSGNGVLQNPENNDPNKRIDMISKNIFQASNLVNLQDKKQIDTIIKDNSYEASSSVNLQEKKQIDTIIQDNSFRGSSGLVNLHAQATSYEKLAEAEALKNTSYNENMEKLRLDDESGLFAILPVSAESANMLPSRKENASGSDLLLEAVLEAEVAHNAKDFFSQAQNHLQEK